MRTSRLGRWVVRGALVAAVVAIGGAGAKAVSIDGEYTWGTAPAESQVVAEDDVAPNPDTGLEENDEYTWG